MSSLRRYEHIAGTARLDVRANAVELYRSGSTIRDIARELGRSYGFVHRLLLEAPDIELRSRGARAARDSDSVAAPALPGQLELADLTHEPSEEAS